MYLLLDSRLFCLWWAAFKNKLLTVFKSFPTSIAYCLWHVGVLTFFIINTWWFIIVDILTVLLFLCFLFFCHPMLTCLSVLKPFTRQLSQLFFFFFLSFSFFFVIHSSSFYLFYVLHPFNCYQMEERFKATPKYMEYWILNVVIRRPPGDGGNEFCYVI